MASKPKLSTSSMVALSGVVVFVMVLVLVFVGRGFIKQISHNSKVISKKQAADKQLTTNLDNLPQLAQKYQDNKNLQPTIDHALPVVADFPGIVATMEVIAGSGGVLLSSVSPGQVTTPAGVPVATATSSSATPQAYAVTAAVSGNYDQILKFLTALQQSARPIKINNLQLNGLTSSLSGSVDMTTYYYDPQVLADKTEAVQ